MITVREVRNVGANKVSSITADTYFSPIVDGVEYPHVGETEDVALLIGLGIKYEGKNTQFPKVATRMLKIDSVWARKSVKPRDNTVANALAQDFLDAYAPWFFKDVDASCLEGTAYASYLGGTAYMAHLRFVCEALELDVQEPKGGVKRYLAMTSGSYKQEVLSKLSAKIQLMLDQNPQFKDVLRAQIVEVRSSFDKFEGIASSSSSWGERNLESAVDSDFCLKSAVSGYKFMPAGTCGKLTKEWVSSDLSEVDEEGPRYVFVSETDSEARITIFDRGLLMPASGIDTPFRK